MKFVNKVLVNILLTCIILSFLFSINIFAVEKDIIFTSGTARGTWWPVTVLLGEILEKEIPDLRVTVIQGGGAYNPPRVHSGVDADLGYTYIETFLNAFDGKKEFEGKPLPNIRAMLSTSITNYSILVRADSDIWSFSDLFGKRFAVALPGQGPELMTRSLLMVYDMDYDSFEKKGGKILHAETAEMATLMKDGHADAVACMGPIRHSIGIELEAWRPIRIVSIDEEKIKEFLNEWPGFAKVELPANIYNGHTKNALSLGTVVTMICNKDLPEDLIYQITKVTIENGNIINEQYKDYAISLENATLGGLDEKYYHPGALKYIKEARGQ